MLELKKNHLAQVAKEGEKAFPYECCGFLLGRLRLGIKQVMEVVPSLNAREDEARSRRYLITPDHFVKTEKYARKNLMDILGFFHSHPNVEARPSAYDTEHAWPWYSYVITSVIAGKADSTTSWILQDDRKQFNREDVMIVE